MEPRSAHALSRCGLRVGFDRGTLAGVRWTVDLLFPSHAMYQAWQKLLPGFTWISWGSFCVGLLESFSSFYASAFKEVIVFTLILPVLLWRSFQHGHHDEEE